MLAGEGGGSQALRRPVDVPLLPGLPAADAGRQRQNVTRYTGQER